MSKVWDEYLVGVLASDEYVRERTGGRAAVFVNSLKVVQFAVRPVSQPPSGLANVRLYYGFSQDLERHGLLDDYAAQPAERVAALRRFLEHQLLVFQPSNKGQYHNIASVQLVSQPLAHRDDLIYLPVPVYSLEVHALPLTELLRRLAGQEFLTQTAHRSWEQSETPACVIWREHWQGEGSWQLVGEFDRHRRGQAGLQLLSASLRVSPFQEGWESEVFEVPGDRELLFVSEAVHRQMIEQLQQAAPYQSPSGEQPAGPAEQQLTPDGGADDNPSQLPPEQRLLARLQQLAEDKGLLYNLSDLINFHTAMKTSQLVILSGLSGTGKSRLIQVYGQALGMDEQQLLIIPVRPAWADDGDLLGWVDHGHLVYRAGDTGLLQLLIRAADNPDRLHLICLDEMNLARVEHYFSQLLAVLELEPPHRYLRLYPDELAAQLHNSTAYPPTVAVGDNLLFAGTINVDESTYQLADKVLDRANVISLELRPFADLLQLPPPRRSRREEEVSASRYRSWCQSTTPGQLTTREVELLQQLHQLLRLCNRNQGIGFRIVRQIGQYLHNLPSLPGLTRAEAWDRQLAQRVLPKLRGPEDQLRPVLGEYRWDSGLLVDSRLLKLLDDYVDLAEFTLCRQVLLQKAKDLVLHGYTI